MRCRAPARRRARARRPQPQRRLRQRRAGRVAARSRDGDEILVGRHRLHFLDVVDAPAPDGSARAEPRRGAPAPTSSGPTRRPRLAIVRGPMAATIAVLSQKGGTGQDDDGADAHRRLPPRRPDDARGRPRPAGQPVRLLRRRPRGRSRPSATCWRAAPRAAEAIHDGIIPANLALAEAELALSGKMGREMTLQRRAARRRADDYDVILIDCPPALGLLTVNALVAADQALLTAEAQYFAMQGVEQALEVIELARENLNPDLEWLGRRAQHRRHAHASTRARRSSRCAEHFGEQAVPDTRSASRSRYAESAERGRVDRRLPPRPGRRLPGAGRRAARAAGAAGRAPAPATPAELAASAAPRLGDRGRARAGAARWRCPCVAACGTARPAPPRRAAASGPRTDARRRRAGDDSRAAARWSPHAHRAPTCRCAATPAGRRWSRIQAKTEFGSARVLPVVAQRGPLDGGAHARAAQRPRRLAGRAPQHAAVPGAVHAGGTAGAAPRVVRAAPGPRS